MVESINGVRDVYKSPDGLYTNIAVTGGSKSKEEIMAISNGVSTGAKAADNGIVGSNVDTFVTAEIPANNIPGFNKSGPVV